MHFNSKKKVNEKFDNNNEVDYYQKDDPIYSKFYNIVF